eukprot:4170675-Ditylum_brightwellii.AAC.1
MEQAAGTIPQKDEPQQGLKPKKYWLGTLITIIWNHAQIRWKYRNQKAHPKGIKTCKDNRKILME